MADVVDKKPGASLKVHGSHRRLKETEQEFFNRGIEGTSEQERFQSACGRLGSLQLFLVRLKISKREYLKTCFRI